MGRSERRIVRTLTVLIALCLSGCGRAESNVEYVGLSGYKCATYRSGGDNHLVVNCYLIPDVKTINGRPV